jgi:hypothetical protein
MKVKTYRYASRLRGARLTPGLVRRT